MPGAKLLGGKKLIRALFLASVILLMTFAVRSGLADSVNIAGTINVEAFPRVIVGLSGNDLDDFLVKNIEVAEQGVGTNHGPMVYLPPVAPSNTVDLFVVLDHSGNTSAYAEMLQMNLEVLVQAMQDAGVDVKVYLTTFDSPDSPADQAPSEFNDSIAFVDYLNDLGFDGADLMYAYGLNKLYHFSTLNARQGAEKVALVLNGSPFYTNEKHPNQTTYTVGDTINQLHNQNFITFVVGSPYKDLHALKTQQVEDKSLSHGLAGGYVGSFAADLSVIHQLLQARDVNKGILMYYSNLAVDQTGPNEIYVEGQLETVFHYPSVDRSDPGYFLHLDAGAIEWGNPVNIAFRLNPIHQLVGLVEVYYLDEDEMMQRQLAQPRVVENNEEGLYYEINLPAEGHPEEFFRYAVIGHTPYGPIGDLGNLVSLPVHRYDEGIVLQSTVLNDSIRWQWSGPTVDAGTVYELRAGDEVLYQGAQTQFEVPVTECFRYQVVHVRAKVNGEWSHFSPPAEAYLGPQGTVSEQEGIEKMLECVENPAFDSVNEVVQGWQWYDPNQSLYLEKTLYYLTRVTDPDSAELKLGRYRLLYFLLQWINQQEYDEYDLAADHIPWSLLYKLITQVNSSSDRAADFEFGLNEVELRFKGVGTI